MKAEGVTFRNLQHVRVKFGIPAAPVFEPRYNFAPTQTVPAVRPEDRQRHLVALRRGLIPSWAKDEEVGYRLRNSRADSEASKPSFRSAFRKDRIAIVDLVGQK